MESSSLRHSSPSSTGVLPVFTTCFGPRTAAAGLVGSTWPVISQSNRAICRAQPEPRRRGPLQDNKLLAEKCHLGFASRMRSEHSDEQSAEQLQEVKHPK